MELKKAGADRDAQGLLLLRIYRRAIDGDMQAAKLLLTAIGEADPAMQDIAYVKLDLAYLKLEALQPPPAAENGSSNLIEALSATITDVQSESNKYNTDPELRDNETEDNL